MSEIITSIMLPRVNNHILSESLRFDVMAGHNVGHNAPMHIVCMFIHIAYRPVAQGYSIRPIVITSLVRIPACTTYS